MLELRTFKVGGLRLKALDLRFRPGSRFWASQGFGLKIQGACVLGFLRIQAIWQTMGLGNKEPFLH